MSPYRKVTGTIAPQGSCKHCPCGLQTQRAMQDAVSTLPLHHRQAARLRGVRHRQEHGHRSCTHVGIVASKIDGLPSTLDGYAVAGAYITADELPLTMQQQGLTLQEAVMTLEH